MSRIFIFGTGAGNVVRSGYGGVILRDPSLSERRDTKRGWAPGLEFNESGKLVKRDSGDNIISIGGKPVRG